MPSAFTKWWENNFWCNHERESEAKRIKDLEDSYDQQGQMLHTKKCHGIQIGYWCKENNIIHEWQQWGKEGILIYCSEKEKLK